MRTRQEGQDRLPRSTWRAWRHRSGPASRPSLVYKRSSARFLRRVQLGLLQRLPRSHCCINFISAHNRLPWQNDVSLDLLDRGTLYDVYCALATPSASHDVCCQGGVLRRKDPCLFPLNPDLVMPAHRVGWSRDEAVQYSCYAQAPL